MMRAKLREENKMKDPMKYTDKDLYELMHKQGKVRFGSECKHSHIKGNVCQDCLRKVYGGSERL